MRFITDLHIHARCSRTTGRNIKVDTFEHWAGLKGIKVLSRGDFTHPNYFAELKTKLISLYL